MPTRRPISRPVSHSCARGPPVDSRAVSDWQFSLFFVALLVGYILLHLRVVRFEEYLRELASLKSLNERVASLTTSLAHTDSKRLERIEELLQRLHEDLEDLREVAQEAGERMVEVVRIPTPVPMPIPGPAGDEAALRAEPGERVRSLVETRLLQLGYTNLRLLTDLTTARLEGDFEVQVECERRNMPAKGRVLLRNGAIRDLALQTVAQTFP